MLWTKAGVFADNIHAEWAVMETLAPAKLNLYLDVTSRRPDGYHELVTLMCCIELYDTVRFTFDTGDIRVSCDNPDIPSDESNIAHRAAALFLRETGISTGVHIEIVKRIPAGAGLGGGSSDAAAVLSSLNSHFGNPVSFDELVRMGSAIGADVPFFIYGKPAIATGIGDILSPFPISVPHSLVLIYPGIAVSTEMVYKKFNLGLTKNEKIPTKIIFRSDWDKDAPHLLFNALEPVASRLCPQIQVAKKKLLDSGAEGALMSGSGSAVFGIFTEDSKADRAFRELSGFRDWRVFRTRLITNGNGD